MSFATENDIEKVKAGLFKRLLAFIIDMLFLGLIGLLLSIPFSGIFYTLGENGSWIGFIISLLYFTIFQTSITKGQTLGYKLFGLSVVTVRGNYLNFTSSIIRNVLLVVIIFNSALGALIPYSNILLLSISAVIFFSYIFSFIAFILFHTQHRGLHDLVAGTFVVKKKNFDALVKKGSLHIVNKPKFNKKAIKISALLIILIIIAGSVITIINPLKNTFMSNLLVINDAVNKDPGVQDSSATINTLIDSNHTTKSLIITASVDRDTFMDDKKLDKLDSLIKEQAVNLYPEINQVDQVEVVFNSGYTIGIWTFHKNIHWDASSPQSLPKKRN